MAQIILTGGGTGGHVYPALAVAESIRRRVPDVSILFVGTPDRLEAEVVPQAGFRFAAIPARGLSRNPRLAALAIRELVRAFWRALRLLQAERPQVVLGTGGYVSAPVLLAARALGIPYLLHEQNVVPGKVNRALAYGAEHVYTSLPGSEHHLPGGKITLVGNPIRRPAQVSTPTEAKQRLGFPEEAPLLLVTGGSQGARRINEAVVGLLPRLLETTSWSVCLVCGPSQHSAIKALVAPYEGPRFQLHGYLEQMPTAVLACDLTIGRAGATTLAELTAWGKPMVLVPYPYAGGHQKLNAEVVTSAGGALTLPDERCTSEALAELLFPVLLNHAQLQTMAAGSRALGRPQAADTLADALLARIK